jgi:hypothetical protein
MQSSKRAWCWICTVSLAAVAAALMLLVRPARPAPALSEECDKPWLCRSAESRETLLNREGGSKDSKEAVARGLEWLALHQAKDGSWSLDKYHQHAHENPGDLEGKEFACECAGQGMNNDIAATAFGLLPFLGAGYTHQPAKEKIDPDYHKTVKAGLDFLLSNQGKDGAFGGGMYAQGLATMAVCEAYGMTRDPKLEKPAQKAIDYIVDAQHEKGGWRYKPKEPGDTSVTGWQLQALKAGKLAGLKVPDDTWKLAGSFLDYAMKEDGSGYGYTGPVPTPMMTASGLLARLDLGWSTKKKEWQSGITSLRAYPPGSIDGMYYHFYASQALFHDGGKHWNEWNEKMEKLVLASEDQGKDSSHAHHKGSWLTEKDPFREQGGRIMATSLSILTLEVYYRYPRGMGAKEEKGKEK